MKIVIANSNSVYKDLENWISEKYDAVIYNQKKDLNIENLNQINPDYIFFPHWSFIIPEEIYSKFECVLFHMTDLPYGRGGSPLQNLIVRGHEKTKLSALRVSKGIDTGEIYRKRDLSLLGTAEEVFIRAGKVMKELIEDIIDNNVKPEPQSGEVVVFKRRNPDQSNVIELEELDSLYDYIRMLDADGYPKAFLETEHFKIEFSRANFKKDSIIADVRITKK